MSYRHITKNERNEISILLNKGYSHRDIADAVGKNRSSISGGISCNSTNGIYNPAKADHKSKVKRINSKYQGMKVNKHSALIDYINDKLNQK
jgi:IS30 family transposase